MEEGEVRDGQGRSTRTGASPVRDNDTGRYRLVNYRRTKFMGVRWMPFTLQTTFLLLSLVYDTHLHLSCVHRPPRRAAPRRVIVLLARGAFLVRRGREKRCTDLPIRFVVISRRGFHVRGIKRTVRVSDIPRSARYLNTPAVSFLRFFLGRVSPFLLVPSRSLAPLGRLLRRREDLLFHAARSFA